MHCLPVPQVVSILHCGHDELPLRSLMDLSWTMMQPVASL